MFVNLSAQFVKRNLIFKTPSGTSRGILTEKPTWYFLVTDSETGNTGIGECSPLPGLSIDNLDHYEQQLLNVCQNIHQWVDLLDTLVDFPSIQFGLEMAMLDLLHGGKHILYPSLFTSGHDTITINGLIWMGSLDYMMEQLDNKLKEGFKCIKLKIGAIDFESELRLLQRIRNSFSVSELELRVDANGAFSVSDAPYKLDRLAKFNLHSIEQPIKQGQWQQMADLCRNTPIPIALDEELIGIMDQPIKVDLLNAIKPQYIILKPSLIGGFRSCENWITLAEQINIGWWATSALESNVGLNAIAQWAYVQNNHMPQGLGTGQLYTNNIGCPLHLDADKISYIATYKWDTV